MPAKLTMAAQTNGNHSISTIAGIYVDTENLREPELAQDVIAQAVDGWSPDYPPVGALSLYVHADKAELWRMWAETTYPDFKVRVRGVQHFSKDWSKNSADLAITADAVGDLASGQTSFVAVISNDSDFGALFIKVREMAQEYAWGQVPLLWITVPDGGGISSEFELFIPDRYRWALPPTDRPAPAPIRATAAQAPPPAATRRPAVAPVPPTALRTSPGPAPARRAPDPPAPATTREITAPTAAPTAADTSEVGPAEVADQLIRELPAGEFRATDAQRVVAQRWPDHRDARVPTAHFGQVLTREIWPEMEKRGVVLKSSSSPRIYEITEAVKRGVGSRRQAPVPPPAPVATVDPQPPTPAEARADGPEYGTEYGELAALIARNISDDIFKSGDAQAIIKEHRPQHASAAYSAQRFGAWFAEHVWPPMEAQGVVISGERPRRYEMTPDARARLIDRLNS